MGFFATIFVGLIAGWLAEKFMKIDMPAWQNLILGLCGGLLGSGVLELLGANSATGIISGILVAFLGACLIVWAWEKIKARK